MRDRGRVFSPNLPPPVGYGTRPWTDERGLLLPLGAAAAYVAVLAAVLLPAAEICDTALPAGRQIVSSSHTYSVSICQPKQEKAVQTTLR
jgi:hypothetical protein